MQVRVYFGEYNGSALTGELDLLQIIADGNDRKQNDTQAHYCDGNLPTFRRTRSRTGMCEAHRNHKQGGRQPNEIEQQFHPAQYTTVKMRIIGRSAGINLPRHAYCEYL